ncbi:MAG: 1-acyl-sn-glycerol-3-phosphate acyltransferase [Anaerolineales bacterium]|nr:1-acyl-sn-glycerol-3-phosphate acyltransferase [Anaerolineales bacterium]
MKRSYTVPFHKRLFRVIMRPMFRVLFHTLARVEINGKDNIPEKAPYLVAINHISLFEPPLVLAFWPITLEAIGASDIWERPGQSVLAKMYGGIQVRRGKYDRQVIENALSALRSGRPLVIAPEGGRSHTPGMRRGLPGVSYMIDQADVLVVPVGIVGSTDDFLEKALKFKRPKIAMNIGKPIKVPRIEGRGEERRNLRQQNTDLIMAHIAALVPPGYRGVYADHPLLKELV